MQVGSGYIQTLTCPKTNNTFLIIGMDKYDEVGVFRNSCPTWALNTKTMKTYPGYPQHLIINEHLLC